MKVGVTKGPYGEELAERPARPRDRIECTVDEPAVAALDLLARPSGRPVAVASATGTLVEDGAETVFETFYRGEVVLGVGELGSGNAADPVADHRRFGCVHRLVHRLPAARGS